MPERVWQELEKALSEPAPSRFFEVLRDCGALARLFPEVENLFGVPQPVKWHPEIDTGVHTMMVLDMAARLSQDSAVRFAALTHDLGKGTTPKAMLPSHKGHEQRGVDMIRALCDRVRAPNRHRELAVIVARHHGEVHKVDELKASTILRVLEQADALRRPQRFEDMLVACEADYRGRAGFAERPYAQAKVFRSILKRVLALDNKQILAGERDPARIPQLIHQARITAIKLARAECSESALKSGSEGT